MRTLVLLCAVLSGILATTLPAAQPVSLQDVLARAAAYHATYIRAISGVQLEEQMQLMDVTGDQTRSVVRLSSDVVLVNVNGQAMALRDPFAIDTRPMRERSSRILDLLGAPATPSLLDWETVSAYPSRALVHYLIDIVLRVNEPTSALQFIAAGYQPNLKYKLDGRKKMNDVDVVGVRFEEPEVRDAKYMLRTRSNARATGRFWVDAVTGAIHQTELWVDSPQSNTLVEHAIVSVKYTPNTALTLLLPSEMNDTYEEFEKPNFRRNVQSRATYSNATFAAIDLTRLR